MPLDYNTNQRLVIDGLQRMWSIIRFLTEDNWKLSTLKDIDYRLSGRRVAYIHQGLVCAWREMRCSSSVTGLRGRGDRGDAGLALADALGPAPPADARESGRGEGGALQPAVQAVRLLPGQEDLSG